MAGSSTVEDLCEAWRRRGGRVTHTLRLVLELLAGTDDHLTASDIAEHVRSVDPRAHLSTIYRTLDRLRDWGVVDHVHLGHGPVAYHLRHRPHHHLVCVGCDTVIDVADEDLRHLTAVLAERHSFTLQAGHVALTGWCERCRHG